LHALQTPLQILRAPEHPFAGIEKQRGLLANLPQSVEITVAFLLRVGPA
jgi:hypothetical protein